VTPGERLGPYEILAQIGAGGMGEVYRARDTRLQRTVAIKVLPRDKLSDAVRKRRFLQEARAASALMHPNIVVLHDISSDAGMDFLVMEYVRGDNLKERIKAGASPFGDVARWGAQIASALAAAHAAGIVHRDIKPANIMITPESAVKVLDFGLAKLTQPPGESEETQTVLGDTVPGMVMGTVAYMSPEQTRGEPLEGRSDIFSLGSVLYEAATGKAPFAGPSTLAVMHEIATANPVLPSHVNRNLPPEFDRVIERALAKNKNERYSSAKEMMEALQTLESRPAPVVQPRREHKLNWRLAAAVSVVLLVAAAAANYRWGISKRHSPDPQAYELYLRGRRDIQEFTEHGFKQAVVDFQNAISRDPEYAAAYAGLADAYSYLAAFEIERPKDVMPLAESNAAKAIEKDPATPEAYTSLGIVALTYDSDFPLAEQRFQRAIKLNPRDAFTQHFLGHYYESMGKWTEALKQMQLAHDMDKLSPMYGEDLAWDLMMIRRNEDAIRQLRETVRLAPEDPFARSLLATVLEASGNTSESLEQAQQTAKLPGMFGNAGNLGGVFCRLHRDDLARDLLKQLEAAERAGTYVAPLEIAMIHFALGDKTKGLARLKEAVDEHSFNIALFLPDPAFDAVREDPEFAALMNRMKLPPAAWRGAPRYSK
jgi:tRNA A-37 threonylcarbamoyl transferase component Bud32/tetratricopeptide (TPR) repeat protein